MCMQNLRRALLGLSVATLVVVGTAVGGPFEDGVAAYQRGDYAIALQSYRKAADQGDARAQNNLGAMYESGRGVPQSYTEAIRWFRLAADQGDAKAQHNLGVMNESGQGVPQSYTEAMRWYRLAADQGYANAQNNLGSMYIYGRGVPQNYAEAMKWFRLAADRGDAQGQVDVGVCYRDGLGVPQDYTEAIKWFRLAANQGKASGQLDLGDMYREGRGVPQDYVEAGKWYRLAAVQGESKAQNGLGVMYRDGQGVQQDYSEAVKWYRLAAEQGNAAAQVSLGAMYANGQGVAKDYVLAYLWFTLSATQSGEGVEQAVKNLNMLIPLMTPMQIAEAQKLVREWKPRMKSPALADPIAGAGHVHTAAEDPIQTVMREFGMLGERAPDCTQPASLANPYLVFYDANGIIRGYTKPGPSNRAANYTIVNATRAGTKMMMRTLYEPQPASEQYLLDISIVRDGSRTRTITSQRVDNGTYLIKDGLNISSEKPVPWLSDCR